MTNGFRVYGLEFKGSDGSRLMPPLFLQRSQARTAQKRLEQEWREFEQSGRGSIFGNLRIVTFDVQGELGQQKALQL